MTDPRRQPDESMVGYEPPGTPAHSPGDSALLLYLALRLRVVAAEYHELRRLLGKEDEVTALRRQIEDLRRRRGS